MQCVKELRRKNEDVLDYVFIYDKARSHYHTYLRDIKRYIYWFMRPTACPEVMPIELVFSVWRRNVRNKHYENED
jgi:hypothetical protein